MMMMYRNQIIRGIYESEPEIIKIIIALKKKWEDNKADVAVSTEGVNIKITHKYLIPLKDILGDVVKLEVHNVGLNNLCHSNCEQLVKIDKKFEKVIGYTITACPCGNLMCMEIHSVVKDTTTDILYDITMDFNEEKTKYFVPFKKNFNYRHLSIMYGREFDVYQIGKNRCKCNIDWNAPTRKFDLEKLKSFLNISDKIIVW